MSNLGASGCVWMCVDVCECVWVQCTKWPGWICIIIRMVIIPEHNSLKARTQQNAGSPERSGTQEAENAERRNAERLGTQEAENAGTQKGLERRTNAEGFSGNARNAGTQRNAGLERRRERRNAGTQRLRNAGTQPLGSGSARLGLNAGSENLFFSVLGFLFSGF